MTTTYSLHHNGMTRCENLNELARRMADSWLENPSGEVKAMAHEGSIARLLNETEFEMVVNLLAVRAVQMGYDLSYLYEDEAWAA